MRLENIEFRKVNLIKEIKLGLWLKASFTIKLCRYLRLVEDVVVVKVSDVGP